MIADMATEIEAARLLMLSAAQMKDHGENYTLQASMAKLYASEMVNRITARPSSFTAATGSPRNTPWSAYYRDARVFTIYEGLPKSSGS
jgi:alkylation response protein AidB-like acyl-CoA dehydrogenase